MFNPSASASIRQPLLSFLIFGTPLPYAMFIIAHANSWFQIAVPCPQRDAHVHGKEITFPLFPPALPKGAANRTALREIDLSRTTPVNEVAEFEMGFDNYSVTTRSVDELRILADQEARAFK
jgi:hypothetical protein